MKMNKNLFEKKAGCECESCRQKFHMLMTCKDRFVCVPCFLLEEFKEECSTLSGERRMPISY